ncbi:MAG: o-succinylbenzoate--CoA ligase [Rubricoccaceae bacterium]|nr:o-succinylbenzoate--CoA ligase [Rubricoccaceae bacterium]
MSAGPPRERLPCPVRRWARERPEGAAMVTPERVWTWAALDQEVTAWAAGLHAAAPTGTRVAVRAETTPRFVALLLAALRTGHVLAPLSPRLPEAAVQEHLDRIACRGLLDLDATPLPRASPSDPRPLDLLLDRPATVVFTSGSTGTPKAAQLTAGNHVWSARGWAERLPLGPGDRWLLDLPLSHVGGLAVVYRCALAGAAVAIPSPRTPTGEAVRRLGATHASLVSTQLRRLLRDAGEPLPTLRALVLGGSAIPSALLDDAHAAGLPVATSYGLTEMASTVTATAPGAARADLGTSGRLLPYRDLRIREGERGSVPQEIEVRGATRFAGYVDGDALTTPFDDDGWFATGDLGHLDGAGRLVVTGRRDNRFVSGGENVQPEAIEAALLALPGVARAVVVPVPDAEFGLRPAAFVVTASGKAPDGPALAAALRERLPGYLVPVAFLRWPEGEGGLKPRRTALRDVAARQGRSD